MYTKISINTKYWDKWGPEYMITVYDPKLQMRGFLVVDNTVLGAGKGGCRMTDSVTLDEVFRLARTMTWKNALAGIPFGGAKSGIIMPKGISISKKKAFVQSFARAIKPLLHAKYIMGPDVNSGEREMDWFTSAIKDKRAATGKSLRNGGLPHELGSTGFGVAHSAMVAMRMKGINPSRAKAAIEGFGNVGSFTFKFLTAWGVKVVGIADSRGAAYKEDGFDFNKIMSLRSKHISVSEYPGAKKLKRDAVFHLDVDLLVPATVTDVINNSNKRGIKAKIIVEGANIPMSISIEKELGRKGMLIIPDFVANAGGVISSYAEYMGYGKEKMFKLVESRIKKSTKAVVEQSIKTGKPSRDIALKLAQKIVAVKAVKARGKK